MPRRRSPAAPAPEDPWRKLEKQIEDETRLSHDKCAARLKKATWEYQAAGGFGLHLCDERRRIVIDQERRLLKRIAKLHRAFERGISSIDPKAEAREARFRRYREQIEKHIDAVHKGAVQMEKRAEPAGASDRAGINAEVERWGKRAFARLHHRALTEVGRLEMDNGFGTATASAEGTGVRALADKDDLSRPHLPHSEDFTSVDWYGTQHRFNKTQAECVRLLWEGGPTLGEKWIGEKIGSAAENFGLRQVFRGKNGKGKHAAWGKMIVSAGKGIYKLNFRESQEKHTS